MKKNELIKKLSEIEGNPEIVVFGQGLLFGLDLAVFKGIDVFRIDGNEPKDALPCIVLYDNEGA